MVVLLLQPPKLACSGRLGFAAIYKYFSGIKLVPSKRRYLVPHTSRYHIPLRGPSAGCFANAHRWLQSNRLIFRSTAPIHSTTFPANPPQTNTSMRTSRLGCRDRDLAIVDHLFHQLKQDTSKRSVRSPN